MQATEPIPVELVSSAPDIWIVLSCIFGIAGFLLSIITIIRQRRKLSVFLNAAYGIEQNVQTIICDITFSNQSSAPISVIKFCLHDSSGGESYALNHKIRISSWIHCSGSISQQRSLLSDVLPVVIPAGGASRISLAITATGFLPFGSDYIHKTSNFWFFKAFTTRGVISGKFIPPTSSALWNLDRSQPKVDFFDLPPQ